MTEELEDLMKTVLKKIRVMGYSIDRGLLEPPSIKVEYVVSIPPNRSEEIEDYLTRIIEYLENADSLHLVEVRENA